MAWQPHPDVWLLMMFLVGAYVLAATKLGPRLVSPGSPVVTTKQKAWFFAGIATLWIASDAPIHDVAEDYLFSVHMVQHLILTMVAPPMILLGIPSWMFRWLFAGRRLGVLRFFTRPVIAFALFNVVVAVTHWPTLVNAAVGNGLIHFGLHTVIVGSAFLMWWPVVDPLPELRRLSEPGKMLYLFGQSILPTVPASFLTFADQPIYSSYASFPRLWGLSATSDQMIAGLTMKLGGGLLLWGIIAVIFFRWYAREESQKHEPMEWDDFEHSLTAWDLRRT